MQRSAVGGGKQMDGTYRKGGSGGGVYFHFLSEGRVRGMYLKSIKLIH